MRSDSSITAATLNVMSLSCVRDDRISFGNWAMTCGVVQR